MFDLSEACSMPVFFNMRIRACHLTGSFKTKNNKTGRYNANNPVPEQNYDIEKIVLPPATYQHEKAKFDERLPAAQRFAKENNINEVIFALSPTMEGDTTNYYLYKKKREYVPSFFLFQHNQNTLFLFLLHKVHKLADDCAALSSPEHSPPDAL